MLKIQLMIATYFISSKDNDKQHLMHSKSDNIDIMINGKADKENFQSLLSRYQIGLETTKKGFSFDSVHLLYYKCHKVNPNQGVSDIDSPD